MSSVRDPFVRAHLAIAALFCTLGFQYATWAARIPALKTNLGLSEAEVGILLMAAGIGAVASFPLVPVLMRRLGSARLALLSAGCLTLLLLGLALAPTFPVALLVMLVDGVFVGCLNVAMNAQGAALESRHGRNAMARLHASFSAGSLLAALIASVATRATPSVTAHFLVAALVLAGLIVAARPGLLDTDAPAEAGADDAEAGKARRRTWTWPDRLTLWLCCAMVFGTVTEGAMTDWSALYLRDVAEAPAALVPLGIAVVSGMMVLARLFADGWRSRWGDGRVVFVGSALGAAGLVLALAGGSVVPALIGFACVGLGFAAVTPCVYVAAARHGSETLTLVAVMGTVGLLAGPPFIGFVASASNLVWGMGVVAVAAAAVTVCSTRIRWSRAGEPAVDPAADPAV